MNFINGAQIIIQEEMLNLETFLETQKINPNEHFLFISEREFWQRIAIKDFLTFLKWEYVSNKNLNNPVLLKQLISKFENKMNVYEKTVFTNPQLNQIYFYHELEKEIYKSNQAFLKQLRKCLARLAA